MAAKPFALAAFAVSMFAAQSAMSQQLFQAGIKVSDISVTVQRDPNAPTDQVIVKNLGTVGSINGEQKMTQPNKDGVLGSSYQPFRMSVNAQNGQLRIVNTDGSSVAPSLNFNAPTGEVSASVALDGTVTLSSHIDQSALLAQPAAWPGRANLAQVWGKSPGYSAPAYPMWYLNPGETLQVGALVQLDYLDANGQVGVGSLPASFQTDYADKLSGNTFVFSKYMQASFSILVDGTNEILTHGVNYNGVTKLMNGQFVTSSIPNEGQITTYGPSGVEDVLVPLMPANSNGVYDTAVPLLLSYTNTSNRIQTGRIDFSHWISTQLNLVPLTVPEPSTWAFMGLGLAGVAGVASRRRKAACQAA